MTAPTARKTWRAGVALVGVALCLPTAAPAQRSQWRARPVERVRNPLVGRGDVGGQVFADDDGDGIRDEDELGLRGVVVVLDDGHYAITDATGRWHMSEIGPGQRAVELRPETLPPGADPGSTRHFGEVPPGTFVRIDFGVKITLVTVELGQEEELGHKIFQELEEIPVSVVGNSTDLQALANGQRVKFPQVELELGGLKLGGYVSPVETKKIVFRTTARGGTGPSTWELLVVDQDGKQIRRLEGNGVPSRRSKFDGKNDQGEPLPAPGAYAARLCVSWGGEVNGCSPYRPFGIKTGSGRKTVRPKLVVPSTPQSVNLNGERPGLDQDGSFRAQVSLKADRQIRVSLQRDDGRSVASVFSIPSITIDRPHSDILIEWGTETADYIAPSEPGPIKLKLAGRVPAGATVQLGSRRVGTGGEGAWSAVADAALGKTRLEFTVTAEDGFNTLYEYRVHLGDRTPDGDRIVVRPGIPTVMVRLPREDAPLYHTYLDVRGNAPGGTTLSGNGVDLPVGSDGSFSGRVPIDLADRKLALTITGPDGATATIERIWKEAPPSVSGAVWLDGEPFMRLVHFPASESGLRYGLDGSATASLQRVTMRDLSYWGSVSFAALDRIAPPATPVPNAPASPVAAASVIAGAETWLTDSFVAGITYRGALFVGGGGSLPMRHEAGLTGGLRLTESFDLQFDIGSELSNLGNTGQNLAAGGGVSLLWRPFEGLDLRSRIGGLIAFGAASGSAPEVLDATLQVIYTGVSGPAISLRYVHLQDDRLVSPEAEGDVIHLSVTHDFSAKFRLVFGTGVWIVPGAVTLFGVSRFEFQLSAPLLVAADYRIQTQLDIYEHAVQFEANYLIDDWIRVGGFYQFVKTTGGGVASSRLQTRIQVFF